MRSVGAVPVLVVLGLLASAPARAGDGVADGAPIAPETAETLYGRVERLREPDGCRLARLDTSRSRITIAITTPTGAEHLLDVATRPGLVAVPRSAGDWAMSVPPALAHDCPATVAAIEHILAETAAPIGGWHVGVAEVSSRAHYVLLAATFVLLILGTLHVLRREAAGSAAIAVALLAVWVVALGLRLWLSPRTFLHEYYHIAETVPAYLSGEVPPGYGKSGPALFRLVGRVLGRADDVRVIFLTNAVVSSLAVPAAAMLVLAVSGSRGQALCTALLLAVLPEHLRFSAAEDLFVQAITFGMWSLALFASYRRSRRLEDALLGALAASLATQARPEMIWFPVAVLAFLLCIEPRDWRVVLRWPTVLAGAVLGVLLVPHALDVIGAAHEARSPVPHAPSLDEYAHSLVLFDPRITPVIHTGMAAIGAGWAALRRPGWLLWVVAVYVGSTFFMMSIFNNPAYRLRAQTLPTTYALLLAAGAVPVWIGAWRGRRRVGQGLGVGLLVLAAIVVVARWRGFVGELKDQQLEWAFLERHVPDLPPRGTLLTAVETGGRNLDAFPEFLLTGSGRRYTLFDVRRASAGDGPWPEATGDLLFYRGMFCYFAFDDEPLPDPMSGACRAVYERYAAEPLIVEDLHTEGYSPMRYAGGTPGVFRIGFYRLTPRT